jgi:serine phosphatase RsbU (regulator of sigma subunit)/anti-sigma regulatory factor (Ser/Thr protein kinase)
MDNISLIAIDDERFNLLLLEEALKGEDIDVTTCFSADKGIELIKANDFDVLLLDVIMPGIDGFELRKIIRESRPHLPIIYLTAIVDTIDNSLIEKISQDKLTYYMRKPFVRDELVKMIRNTVAKKRSEEQSQELYSGIMEDLALAAEVQRLLIPDWVILDEDVIVSSIYEPSQKISGDMFDMIRLSSGKYFFFIGDIAGHGVQAALYMSAIQSVLKMIIGMGNWDITTHEVLNRLNLVFCTELGQEKYMTCMVGIFDFAANELEFFNAGHPNLAVFNPESGVVELLNPGSKGGIPVGWDKYYEYKKEDVIHYKFSDDSIFFMTTDGTFEISNSNDQMLGFEKMIKLLDSLVHDQDSAVIPYRVREALPQMGYSVPIDDMTIITVKKVVREQEKKGFKYWMIHPLVQEVNKLCTESEKYIVDYTSDIELSVKIELILGEFLNNIVMHGLGNSQQSRPGILVQIKIAENEVIVKILDKGKKWSFNTSPVPISEDLWNKDEQFATSGRGMTIIRSIASEISRNRYNDLNETVFKIRRTPR